MAEEKIIKKRQRKVAVTKKEDGLTAPKKLNILVTIVDRSKADFYLDTLEGYEVNLQTVIFGKGTAPSDIQQYLGLSQMGKAVIFSIVKEENVKKILADYEDKYFKTKNGKGIAFTIPISSMIGVLIYQFLCNNYDNKGVI